jgi:hypothetical protein
MSAYFVMIREQTVDPTALADYGPRASLVAQGHPLKPLAAVPLISSKKIRSKAQ